MLKRCIFAILTHMDIFLLDKRIDLVWQYPTTKSKGIKTNHLGSMDIYHIQVLQYLNKNKKCKLLVVLHGESNISQIHSVGTFCS